MISATQIVIVRGVRRYFIGVMLLFMKEWTNNVSYLANSQLNVVIALITFF